MRPKLKTLLITLFCIFLSEASVLAQSKEISGVESWLASGFKGLDRYQTDLLPEGKKSKPANHRCSLLNFDLFFTLFSEDKYFQESASVFPLKHTFFDYQKNYKESITYLSKKNDGDGLNVFPNRHQRTYEHLSYFFEPYKNSHNQISVILRGEGGIHYEYIFIWDRCWFLSEIIDSST